jgi:F-type H+-transporting ATPase subunit gamma
MSAGLKEVRERIASVKSTQQITKAMKMVSAAKLRKAQEAILQLRPYALKLNDMLKHLVASLPNETTSAFGEIRDPQRVLIYVITSDRGLCGAFNSNICKEAAALINEKYSEQRKKGNVVITCIGKRGYDFFKRRYSDCTIVTDYMDLFNHLTFANIAPLADLTMKRFKEEQYDRVYAVYGKFKNAGVQYPTAEQFLPVQSQSEVYSDEHHHRADYIFEPDKETLLKQLVPSILQAQFKRYLLDTQASEHGARMTAMGKATENAEEMVKELRISYNKARQETITMEIAEIVGGAAALGS